MNKIRIFLLLGFSIISNAFSQNLTYSWTPNKSYSFKSTVKDSITTSMMGMNVNEKFITTTDFILFITSVKPDGSATGKLYLIDFQVKTSKGQSLATLANIPKEAITSDFTVTNKGRFTFPKEVQLITTPTSNYLVYAKDDNQPATNQSVPTSMDAYAEFDVKTGKIKPGYVLQKNKPLRKVTVKENEQSDEIEIFPYDFLEALALPEGIVTTGDHYQTQTGMYNMDILVASTENGLATVNYTLSTNKDQNMFGSNAKGSAGDGAMNFDMNSMMGGMGNMAGSSDMGGMGSMSNPNIQLSDEDKKAMDMAKSASPGLTGDIQSQFNYTTGEFKQVSGFISNETNIMGMKMNAHSTIKMVAN